MFHFDRIGEWNKCWPSSSSSHTSLQLWFLLNTELIEDDGPAQNLGFSTRADKMTTHENNKAANGISNCH
jgi:hypothetical protein